ncbi:hypothetical protein ABEB36_015587 [Hypothenemus hampei]|uniref:DDE Tnp4 domain-containing protein n=1 Tax=Hypothenemus hampei TaxID=57062 RepID=A0ABD1DZD4_HYPHA
MSDEEYSEYSELSDISSMESSDDDDLELLLDEERIKNENYLENIVPEYSETVFFEHFRLGRQTVHNITERFQISQYFNSQVGQYGNISALHQVHIYLWYVGHQTASFRDVGDRFDVTISSVNRIIHRLSMFLSNLSPEILRWPNEDEKRISENHFRASGFPNVIGAIDGTHIKLDKAENDPDSYLNRKGYYSIQMQAVCDHRRKIIDVFIGYPGSVHDSRIFSNSPLKASLQEKCGRYFLLGDSGYPLLPNLLTPYKDRGNLTRRQQNYNVQLSKNRYIIEHCFGVLKQKFRQLYHLKIRRTRLICHFIRAACVLHNMALDDYFVVDVEPVEIYNNILGDEENDGDENMEARVIRDQVANTLPM